MPRGSAEDALELFRSLDDFKGVAEATTGLALIRSARGDYPEAETLYREALSIYEGLGDEAGIARTLDRFALNFVITGEFDRARPLFERSLGLFRRLGDSHGVALGLYGLAVTRLPGAHVAALAQARREPRHPARRRRPPHVRQGALEPGGHQRRPR